MLNPEEGVAEDSEAVTGLPAVLDVAGNEDEEEVTVKVSVVVKTSTSELVEEPGTRDSAGALKE